MEPEFLNLYDRCKGYTMTSIERMYAIFKAVEYICKDNIPGDYVECGVWKGGSSMMAALSFMHFGKNKELWLYDTFEGMSEATDNDIDCNGVIGKECVNKWPVSLAEVKENMDSTGYAGVKRYVKGKVEDMLQRKGHTPARISLLRLDTDWYESTLHELTYLYPLLISGGMLIIDDYGHWQGARRAVDEYFESIGVFPYLHQIDYTGRIMIKL